MVAISPPYWVSLAQFYWSSRPKGKSFQLIIRLQRFHQASNVMCSNFPFTTVFWKHPIELQWSSLAPLLGHYININTGIEVWFPLMPPMLSVNTRHIGRRFRLKLPVNMKTLHFWKQREITLTYQRVSNHKIDTLLLNNCSIFNEVFMALPRAKTSRDEEVV